MRYKDADNVLSSASSGQIKIHLYDLVICVSSTGFYFYFSTHPWWNYLSGIWAFSNCGTVTLTAYEIVKNHGDSNLNFHKNSQERKCRNQYWVKQGFGISTSVAL